MFRLLRAQAIFLAVLFLAIKEWVGTESIQFNKTKNWSPEGVPAQSSEVTFKPAVNCEQNSTAGKCKQLDFTGYTATFSGGNTGVLSIGTNAGTGTALKLVGTMTLTCESELKFISTSGVVEGITTAGKTLTFGLILFNGVGGKWQLQDNFTHTSGNGVTLQNGTLDLNAKTVTVNGMAPTGGTLKMAGATIILNGTGNVWGATGSTTVLEGASTSTIEVNGPLGSGDFQGGGLTYGTVRFVSTVFTSRQEITGSSTIATLVINNKGATAGKGLGLEVGSTTTVTTAITSNGVAGTYARLESAKAGERAKVKIPEGTTLHVKGLAVKDIEIVGGGSLVVEEGKDEGNNAGVTFGAAFARTCGDTITVSDSASRGALALARTAGDTVAETDAASRAALTLSRAVGDVVSQSDAAARAALSLSRGAGDTVTQGDAATPAVSLARAAAETVALSEAAARTAAMAREAGDTVIVSDGATGNSAQARTATDTVTQSDSASRTAVSFARAAAETVALSEAVNQTVGLLRVAADSASLGGSTATATSTFMRTADDSATLTSVASPGAGAPLTAGDTVSTGESVTANTAGAVTASDTASVSGVASRGVFAATRTILELAILTSTVAAEVHVQHPIAPGELTSSSGPVAILASQVASNDELDSTSAPTLTMRSTVD